MGHYTLMKNKSTKILNNMDVTNAEEKNPSHKCIHTVLKQTAKAGKTSLYCLRMQAQAHKGTHGHDYYDSQDSGPLSREERICD